jgi:GT2 family glycosyltransferase
MNNRIVKNWILMPTLNCRALTERAVASCAAQDMPTKLFVIDSSSDDGTAEWLRSQPGVHMVTAPRTAGVSYVWNRGLDYLLGRLPYQQDAESVLVINSDVELRPDTLRLLLADGSPFVTAVGSSTAGTQYPGGTPTMARRPHPDFSCFLIRRECWERVGRFDESMSIYCSDGDYHLRMHQAGIDAHCIDLPFLHYASGTLKQADDTERERIMARADLDRKAFEKKWGVAMGTAAYYELFGHGSPEPR